MVSVFLVEEVDEALGVIGVGEERAEDAVDPGTDSDGLFGERAHCLGRSRAAGFARAGLSIPLDRSSGASMLGR